MLRHLAALTLALFTACDDPDRIADLEAEVESLQGELATAQPRLQLAAPDGLTTSEVSFRGDSYLASYITAFKGANDDAPQAIDFDRFVEAYLACKAQEPGLTWTMTLTRYHPEFTSKTTRVVGFGGSALSEGPGIQCWEKLWAGNGEVFLP